MKRIASSLIILLAIAGIAAAQSGGAKAPDSLAPGQAQGQAVARIEGKLALVNGEIGIAYKDKTYYLAMPKFLFGFIDGLKEGAQVKLEGYEFANPRTPEYVQFQVTKLSFNGRDYDLTQAGRRGRMGAMMGGNDIGGPCDGAGQGMGAGRRQGKRR